MLRENISVGLKAGSFSLLGMNIANPHLKKRKINGSVTAGDSVFHLQQQCYIHLLNIPSEIDQGNDEIHFERKTIMSLFE